MPDLMAAMPASPVRAAREVGQLPACVTAACMRLVGATLRAAHAETWVTP